MKSSYGRRAAMIKNTGLTWREIHHEIPFSHLQRILADMPQYHYDKDNQQGSSQTIHLTPDTSKDLLATIAQFNTQ